jgi:hypothetical protein
MSGLGFRFPKLVLRELKRLGIECRPEVRIVHQKKNARWLIAGEEGGGAEGAIGHYVGFVGVSPEGVAVSLPIRSFIPNRIYRKVFAQDLLRLQVFRYEQSINLSITRHCLVSPGPGRRPELISRDVFIQREGLLTNGSDLPVFIDRTGEPVDMPADLIPAIKAACRGVATVRNKRAHLIGLPDVTLPPIVISKATVPENVSALPVELVPAVETSPKRQSRGRRVATKPAA